ncbi:hypothetical protein TEMA_13590 [Terrisporobacter mayombei]|uniref:Uncharacterized protein n=1 Tax=Terrisporobacter mayombei TaxID=1541 RepID=A0ABY9Q359_9FIRM|nr:hypothetical protein TEMA_13590 [Terrisporobacter mayombei]
MQLNERITKVFALVLSLTIITSSFSETANSIESGKT